MVYITAVLLIIVVTVSILRFRRKNEKLFDYLINRIDLILDDPRVTPDFAPIARNLIGIMDKYKNSRSDDTYMNLLNSYKEVEKTKCFHDLKYEIDEIFDLANSALVKK